MPMRCFCVNVHPHVGRETGRRYRTCTFTLPPRSAANSEGWHPCNQQFPHGQNSAPKQFLRPPSAKPGTDREPQLRRSHCKILSIETAQYWNVRVWDRKSDDISIIPPWHNLRADNTWKPRISGPHVRASSIGAEAIHCGLLTTGRILCILPISFELQCSEVRNREHAKICSACHIHNKSTQLFTLHLTLCSVQLPCPLLAQPPTTISGFKSLAMQKHQKTTPYIFQRTP